MGKDVDHLALLDGNAESTKDLLLGARVRSPFPLGNQTHSSPLKPSFAAKLT
jgi:hypothetical protein